MRTFEMGITWLFFDVGMTLVDEGAACDHRIREMIEGTPVSYAEFDEKRKAYAREGKDGNAEAIRFFGLSKTSWHTEDERLFPGVPAALQLLRERSFRQGIIANQQPGLEERLKHWGIRDFFKIIVSSAEIGVSKPDPAIFEMALSMAGCRPEEAVMIGDRIDNDVVPAKTVGMRTVWVRQGLAAWQPEACPEADQIVSNILEVPTLF